MINLLVTILKVVFLLGFLVFIHEGGHFLVAKLCHVKVYEFAIGFGHILWKKQGKETLYCLRAIPLGGFNRMEQEGEDPLDSPYEKAKPWKRFLILLAGGTVNIIFGILIYFTLMVSIGNYTTTNIDQVIDGYNSVSVLQPDDQILEINGKKVNTKEDLAEELAIVQDNECKCLIKRDGEKKEVLLTPNKIANKSIGIYLSATNQEPEIISIANDSPAAKANIQVGDVIEEVDGTYVKDDVYKCMSVMNDTDKQDVTVKVIRDNREEELTVTPDIYYTYIFGISLKQAPNTFFNKVYFGGIATKEYLGELGNSIAQMFKGKISVNDFTGPVGIGNIVSKTQSFASYVYILSAVSISLGFTNLLPIPPLDGGKILILLIEKIRRKRFNQETMAKFEVTIFAILILLSLFITYNDILRIV